MTVASKKRVCYCCVFQNDSSERPSGERFCASSGENWENVSTHMHDPAKSIDNSSKMPVIYSFWVVTSSAWQFEELYFTVMFVCTYILFLLTYDLKSIELLHTPFTECFFSFCQIMKRCVYQGFSLFIVIAPP